MKLNWKMIISGLLLLWSIMGLIAFYSQSTMSAESLAQLDSAQQDIWAQMPKWVWADYGIAVLAGFIGAIGLLLRRAWSISAYAISLITVVVQFAYVFLATPILQTKGLSTVPFPALIIAVGAYALWQTRLWKQQAWLS